MNIGLVLFATGILFGNTPDDNSTGSSKNQQSEVKQESTIELDPNKQKSQIKDFDSSINQTNDIEQISKGQNNAPSITGNARQQVKQDEYYTFSPYAHDLDGDKLLFSIINRPKWIAFDSRTGSIIGQPVNSDVGFTKEITITAKTGGQIATDTFNIDIKPKHVKSRKISSQIDVCWDQFSGNQYSIDIPQHDSSADINQNNTKEVIKYSWENNTAIVFKWHDSETCPEQPAKTPLKIAFANIVGDAKKTEYFPEQHKMIIDPSAPDHNIIHEFGHALGFPDEHARLDVYRGGSYEQADNGKVCTQIVNGTPILAEDHTYHGKKREELGLKVISMADWQQQTYNPFSVMNDCTSAEDYKDKFIDADKKIFLSDEDINRAQQFYGAPLGADQTEHMMKDGDQFFTGLLKKADGSGYDFYKYGVKNHNYNIDTVLKIMNSGKRKYFYIYEKSQSAMTSSQTFLFEYITNKEALIPNNNLILSCYGNKDPSSNPFDQCRQDTFSYTHDINGIRMPIKKEKDEEDYSYYYYDFYGQKNQFSTIICKNQHTDIAGNTTKYKFLDIYNCIDSLAEELDPFIRFEYQDFYPPFLYFMKGKLISGGLFGNALDIRFDDGKFVYPEKFLEPFGENNKKLRYKDEDGDGGKPLTGSISKALSYAEDYYNQEIGSFKKGYYLEGMYVEDNKVVSEDDFLIWKLTDFEGNYYPYPLLLTQKNIYAFVNTADGEGETEKLYKNGELYSGEFDSKIYDKGVLEQ